MSVKEFNGGLQSNQEVTIGIDQSLTGFALSAVSIEHPSTHMTWVYKSPYKGVQRLADIQNFMFDKLEWLKEQGNPITEIAMEAPFLGSPSTLPLSELAAAIKLFLYDHFYSINNYNPEPPQHLRTPLVIPPMTLKKYATGKGTAKKQEMLLQIYKRFNVEFSDDNAADAYALARLAAGITLNASDKEVVEKIKDPKYRDFLS